MDDLARRLAGKRLLILTTWADDGRWAFLNTLRGLGLAVDLLEPPLARSGLVPGKIKGWLACHSSLAQCVQALMRSRGYDAVVTWNTRAGVTLGALSRLLPRPLRPRHLLRDFHLDLTRFASLAYYPRVLMARLAVPGVDAFLTTSTQEADLYALLLGIPERAIRFFPDTPGGSYLEAGPPDESGDYVFAYGNSDRDFDTLTAAAGDIGRPVVILSQNWTPRAALPPNVTLITRRVPLEELMELIGRAALVALPIKSRFVAAGQNAMLEVMCLERPLVVTSNLTTLEHADHGREALFVPPRDPAALALAARTLLADPEAAREMGARARRRALGFPEEQAAIFLEELARVLDEGKAGPA